VGIAALVTAVADTPYQEMVMADGPLLYWTFDEGGDTDNAQSLANNVPANELVAQGGATRVPSTAAAGGASLGRAAAFDGVNGSRFYANTLSPGAPTYSHYAVELWIQLSDAAKPSYIVEGGMGGGGAGGNHPAMIHGYDDPNLEFFGGGRRTGTGGPTDLADNDWHHIVMVVNDMASNHTFYIDGELYGTFNESTTWDLPALGVGSTQLGIGPDPINGRLDEVALYDLSGDTRGEDIARHYYGQALGRGLLLILR
jgi:hypothetical protein